MMLRDGIRQLVLMVWFIDEDLKSVHIIPTIYEIAGGLHDGIA